MAIEGPSGSGFDDQFWPTDAVNPGIFWESPHPLSIVGVALRHQTPAAGDRERPLPGQEADAADRRLSILPHGTTNDPGFEAMLWLRKGFDFAGAWTVCEQNQLLSVCFGLPAANKA